jgi:hypothetical protein
MEDSNLDYMMQHDHQKLRDEVTSLMLKIKRASKDQSYTVFKNVVRQAS